MELGDLRRHHLSLVVEALAAEGPRSRAELAQGIGLTKATVSALVADLVDRGLVAEREARREGRMGRPGIDLELRSAHIGALGLEIRVDEVAACVVDLAGTVRSLHRRSGDNRRARPATVVDRLLGVARSALDDAAAQDVRSIGGALAVPGLVTTDGDALVVSPNLDWHEVVPSSLGAELGLELPVENEANLAALAELRHGVGRDLASFVLVSAGVGVGGALVLDRSLVRGFHGFACEVGHVVVDPSGPRCACGARGCLEAVVGRAADASPAVVADALGSALRSVVHLVDPEAVVLGGRLAEVPGLVAALAERLAVDTLGGRTHPCEVRTSTLGLDAALIGAATATLDDVVADPTTIPTAETSADDQQSA
ncbi:MAG: ROK family transcriptional regulator [Actinobacteria bacterium]|nr:ROK family transcriptional regulator [Actinomycetota bacterium]